MKFIQPPKTEYTDYYEQSKFNLVWNFTFAILILLVLVTISNLSNSNYSSIPNFIAVSICAIVLFALNQTKKYKTISIIGTVSIFSLISITFFLQENVIHYTTPMWMTLNILLAFFMLGKRWGTAMLISHFIVMFFYFAFKLQSNIENIKPFDNLDIANFIIESAIIGSGILYILLQYIKTTKRAEDEIKSYNDSLLEKNTVISTQNQEKEVMLKEIHHRVKNNLQIITSILRLQSNDLKDEEHISPFKEAINRVSSISLIHEKMYQSDMLTNFDLEDYFESLALNIIASYSYQKEIKLNVKSSLDCVQCKSIVPIALLYNELVTNSIKHAYENIEAPEIRVLFTSTEPAIFKMTYSDNGQWKESSKDSFGTEMIETMTEQLEGEYSIDKSEKGTTYHFTFKDLDDK